MKLLWLILFYELVIIAADNIQSPNYAIIKSMKMFQMSNPSIVHSSLNRIGEIKLFKSFSNHGHKIIFNPVKSNLQDFMVIFTELNNYKWNEYPETHVPTLGRIQMLENSHFSQ